MFYFFFSSSSLILGGVKLEKNHDGEKRTENRLHPLPRRTSPWLRIPCRRCPRRRPPCLLPLFPLCRRRRRPARQRRNHHRLQPGERRLPLRALCRARRPFRAARVLALAIASRAENAPDEPVTPCGACRQVMAETAQRFGSDFDVLLLGATSAILTRASALLPFAFRLP